MFSFYRDNARWLAGGFFLMLFSCFGQTFFISIWGAEIREAFDLSHGGFGGLYMGATLASAACLPFVGRLVDIVSVPWTVLIIVPILAVATLAMSVANSLVVLALVLFVLRLFGQGMMTHTAITAMGRWFGANRGKAVASASIGISFAEAAMPLAFVTLAASVGWRASWLVAAAMLGLIALPLIYALMRRERLPRGQVEASGATSSRQWTRAEMLRDPLFWLTCIGIFAPPFIGTSIFFHQDYLIALNGWAPALFYGSFSLMAGTTIVTSLATGWLVDRSSAAAVLPYFLLPLGAACLLLGYTDAVVVFFVLLGVSSGMGQTLFGAFWPEAYGTLHLGSIRSVTISFAVFMTAAGPGFTGGLIDAGVPFETQLVWIGLFCFAGAALLAVASRGYRARLEPAAVGV